MNLLKFQTNQETGEFLVRTRKVDNLPEGLVKPEGMKTIVDVFLIMKPETTNQETVCFVDIEDFKPIFDCTDFQFKAQVRAWLELVGRADGQWVRMDILVPEEAITPAPTEEVVAETATEEAVTSAPTEETATSPETK